MENTAKKQKVGLDLTEGSVLQSLLLFAMPVVLANLIQQLYSMVDLMVVGQFVGSVGTVGVSIGGEISDLLTPIATSFAAAGQVYISQLAGAKEHKEIQTAIGTMLTFMLGMSTVFLIVTALFRTQILTLLNCPDEAFGEAMSYMLITTAGMPFIFGYNAICGVLRGLGESKKPLLFIIIAAVVNIVLDLIMVALWGWGATGTAIATVLAQIVSCLAAFFYLYLHRDQLGFEWKLSYFKLDKTTCSVLCGIGIPQAIRSCLVRFSILWVNSNVNGYGLTVSATNSVGNKIQKFLDVFSSSISQAAGAMIGQNLGARKLERAKKIVLYALGISLCFAGVICLSILVAPRALFSIFTSDQAVIEGGVTYMRIMMLHFIWSAITGSFQSMVIGSGFAALNFVIGILDGVVCKIGFSLIFVNLFGMGFTGYFWATSASRIIPGIINMIYFFSGKWKTRKLLGKK